jgi:lysophospholipase L1-like esterase
MGETMKSLAAAAVAVMSLVLAVSAQAADLNWARSWGASPQGPIVGLGPPFSFTQTFHDVTLRQVVRLSGGGRQVRVRFTNEFGAAALAIGAAHVAVAADNGAIQPGSDRVLTFAGKPTATVPVGAPLVSDPVDLVLPARAKLTISLYLPGQVDTCTCHGTSAATGWTMPGNSVGAPSPPADTKPLPVRALISAVDVGTDTPARTIVAFGDSITDGVGATTDADKRWPDQFAERLIKRGGPAVYVSNQGISGNRVLNDGMGVAALSRFDRDVLSTPGLAYVIVFEGINDIGISFAPRSDTGPLAAFMKAFGGAPVSADDIIAGYRQLIARAHQHGVKIYAATVTPYGGAGTDSPQGEAARQAVNAWIRTSGAFDAVLDFDAVWRDPAKPGQIRDGLHAGDHLHGSDAGYKALADSIDLNLFR